jgi:hypothetical protein
VLRSPSLESAKALIESVGGDARHLNLLPPVLRAYISHDFVQDIGKEMVPRDLIEKNRPGFTSMTSLRLNPTSALNFETLINEEVWWYMYLLITKQFGAPDALNKASFQKLLFERITKQRPLLLDFAASWGALFEFPDDLGERFRRKVIVQADNNVRHQVFWHGIDPFYLRLPNEADLLPHIVNVLVSFRYGRFDRVSETSMPRQRELSHLIGKYVSNVRGLNDVFGAPHFAKRVRAAATILYYLHPEIIESGAQLSPKDILIDYYEPTESEWYLPAAALLLSDAIAANQSDALETMGRLIGCANADYPGRYAVNSIIREWRELARAPVQHLATPSLWK